MEATARRAQRAAAVSLLATIVVVAVKLIAAYLSGSVSVLSEGLQSMVDILMSGLAVYAVAYAAKPADRTHPYGHGKAELLAGAFQMLMVMGTSIFIAFEAYKRWNAPQPIRWDIGAAAMGYALASNLMVQRYLQREARATGSASLDSEAKHLSSDSLMSAGVLVGMVLVGLTQWQRFDPLAAALTALVGMGIAIRQLNALLHPLMDGALPEGQVEMLEQVLKLHPEVKGYHKLRTRSVGSQRFIDLHVLLEDDLSFVLAHDIAEQVEEEIRQALGGAIVSIHYEPHRAELEHEAAAHPEQTTQK
jgi:cation diffusion facilitator family transporter